MSALWSWRPLGNPQVASPLSAHFSFKPAHCQVQHGRQEPLPQAVKTTGIFLNEIKTLPKSRNNYWLGLLPLCTPTFCGLSSHYTLSLRQSWNLPLGSTFQREPTRGAEVTGEQGPARQCMETHTEKVLRECQVLPGVNPVSRPLPWANWAPPPSRPVSFWPFSQVSDLPGGLRALSTPASSPQPPQYFPHEPLVPRMESHPGAHSGTIQTDVVSI